MAKEKVTLRIEKGEMDLLKAKYNTDNQSESIRLAICECLLSEDKEKIKTLFSYIGKKPPRIGKEVAEIFRQSGCSIFVDLFCGSIAMLCYLSWETVVVVNDINGNLTNLYMVIRDSPSAFVSELMKLPYSEVLFQKINKKLNSGELMKDLERAVAYYYVSFGTYRGRVDNALFQFFTCEDTNRADTYKINMKWVIALSKRLQSVVILNRDFREVLKSYNKEHVFIYADCPYLGTEYYYDHVFTIKDHEDLASMLKSHKGTFALSSKYGNMIEEKDKKGNVTKYEYDKEGNITKQIDPNGGETTYEYDEMGRVISELNDIGSKNTYTYNALGLLKESENARGQKATYTYDLLGRIKIAKDSDGTISYIYMIMIMLKK